MLANTKNQELKDHSFAIGELAVVIFEKLIFETNINKIIENENKFKEIVRFSGYLHDIGKIDSFFQKLLIESKPKEKIKFETTDGTHVQDKKITLENYIRHNELSCILINALIDKNKIKDRLGNKDSINYLTYIAYWHHAKIVRKEKKEINAENLLNRALKENSKAQLEKDFKEILKGINSLYNIYYDKKEDFLEYIQDFNFNSSLPDFKSSYTKIGNKDSNLEEIFASEARKSLLRTIVVTADRIISNLSNEELLKYIRKEDEYTFSDLLIKNLSKENLRGNLEDSITKMITRFNDSAKLENNIININRNKKQTDIVKKLVKYNEPVILSGPAGCGKTKIFLEWIKEKESLNKNNKQVFIIAPRNMICKGLYDELIENYLPNESIEIYTGEYQFKYRNGTQQELEESEQFTSNIIVTTIDQIINIMLSHKKIDILLTLLDSYLIFDEFHELFNISGVVLLFKELLLLKQIFKNSQTLLVSATPNYYFSRFLNCPVEKIEASNNEDYIFEFKKVNDINSMIDCEINNFDLLPELKDKISGSIIIYNTATTSQVSSLYNHKLRNENNLNYHSKFNKNDKLKLSKEVLQKWKKIGTSEKVLRAGPIIQASLNITTHLMLTEMTSAENWCQRLGRLNRFADINVKGKLITYYESILLDENIKKIGSIKVLDHLYQLEQTISWCKFILEKFNNTNTNISNIKEIYCLYEEYHNKEETKLAYENDFTKILEESKNLFENNNSFEPYQFVKTDKEKTSNKLSKRSVRGSSLYVLPTKLNVKTGAREWLYYPLNNEDANINNAMSLGIKEIEYDYDLILKKATDQAAFFSSKETGNKNAIILYEASLIKKLNSNIVLKKAREINYPLIISTIDAKTGKFYMNYDKLLIGLLDIKKLEDMNQETLFTKLINSENIDL